ncbi:MAG: DUF2586 family protein [Bacteroidales bacterium]
MQSLKFNRTNGNVPRTLAGQDHISGLLYFLPDGELPTGFTPEKRIQLVSTIETAEGLGITADATSWHVRNLHYQLSNIYRLNNGVTLYVGLFATPTGAYTFAEVKAMQNFAGGDIRQIGVWNGEVELTATDLTTLQGVATVLEAEDTPLSIIYAPKVVATTDLPTDLSGENKKNISVIIGQDAEGVAKTLFDSSERNEASVSAIGIAVGITSVAAVHHSIAWVQQYPTGIALPAFGDGTLLRSLDKGVVEALDNARYLFFTTYSGIAGSFFNDSHNMDSAISDYAHIERVRTMDKAIRGVRAYLLPELGSPLYIDPDTGTLSPDTVKHLENVAGRQLSAMEAAGELSGYVVEIDPNQNVAASSAVEFVVKNVAVGVFRKGVVNIGYALSI